MTAPFEEPGLPPYPPAPILPSPGMGGAVLRPLTPAMIEAVRHHERKTRRAGYRSLAIFALLTLAPVLYLLGGAVSGTPPGSPALAAGAAIVAFLFCLLILPVCVALWRNAREARRLLAGPCAEYTGPWAVRRRVLLLPAGPGSPAVRLPLAGGEGRVLADVPWGAVTFLPEPPLLLAVRDAHGAMLFRDAGYRPTFGEWHGERPPRADGPSPA